MLNTYKYVYPILWNRGAIYVYDTYYTHSNMVSYIPCSLSAMQLGAVGSLSSWAHQEDLNRQKVELMLRMRDLRQCLVKNTRVSLSLDPDIYCSLLPYI